MDALTNISDTETIGMFEVRDGLFPAYPFERWADLGHQRVIVKRRDHEVSEVELTFVSGDQYCVSQYMTPENARAIGEQLIAAAGFKQ
jgi:hypothetical protein